ncbi:hypothetical protein OVO43_12200, partial [Streptococcus pneumoniae]|nr:hypothetical protein [Streptococcus pneumoniae]
LGMPDVAMRHAGLMEAVRREQDWPLRPSHQDLILRVLAENGLLALPQKTSREWKQVCRDHWGTRPGASLASEFRPVQGEAQEGR